MNIDPHEELYCRIHDYVTAELEGEVASEERRRFVDLLCSDLDARRIYIEYIEEQASLRWCYANQPWDLLDQVVEESRRPHLPLAGRTSRSSMPMRWAAVAAALLAMIGGGWWLAGRSASQPGDGDSRQERLASRAETRAAGGFGDSLPSDLALPKAQAVATLTRLIDVQWIAKSTAHEELARLRPGQTLEMTAGQIELVFDTGVEVILKGPSHLEIRSADRAFCRRGAISARAGNDARGFTIETPKARVIDLGTEFGVSISETGETEVAVFDGIVDLSLEPKNKNPLEVSSKRLNQGEALRVGANGEFQRVFSVASDQFPTSAARRIPDSGRLPLISEVRDNIRAPESQKFYKIVRSGLVDDAPAFVDRVHQWNGIDDRGLSSQLLGAEYVMPFNDDKQFSTQLEVTLFVARPATLFVFLSDAVEAPEWLTTTFVDTGENIGLDEGPSRFHPARTGRRELAVGTGQSVDTVFSIWKRDVPRPGHVVLGGVARPTPVTGFNMYGIATIPLD